MRITNSLKPCERAAMAIDELEAHEALMQRLLDGLENPTEDEKCFYLCEQIFDRARIIRLLKETEAPCQRKLNRTPEQ